jgi:hypothetical protein
MVKFFAKLLSHFEKPDQNSNYLGFGLYPSSGIQKNTREHTVSETGSLSSGKGKTPILLGPLERANLSHWTTYAESESRYDRRSAGQSVLVSSPIWGS